MPILEVTKLKKTYTPRFGAPVPALESVTFSVEPGEYLAVMGESGSGKTTLLNILAALDRPTDGEVMLDGKSILTVKESDIAAFRRDNLGFVFQDFNLLDTFNIRDNIFLPLVLAGRGFDEMNARLVPLAEKLGIGDILEKFPYEVSGGQKQRAAVARALITDPRLVLADEPTGALDSASGRQVMELFDKLHEGGVSIVMITHDAAIAACAQTVYQIRDGVLSGGGDAHA